MLQNARVVAFTVSELLRENQEGGGAKITLPPHPPRLGLSKTKLKSCNFSRAAISQDTSRQLKMKHKYKKLILIGDFGTATSNPNPSQLVDVLILLVLHIKDTSTFCKPIYGDHMKTSALKIGFFDYL